MADCDDEGRVTSDLWTQEQTLSLLLEIFYVPYFHVIKPSAFDFEHFQWFVPFP